MFPFEYNEQLFPVEYRSNQIQFEDLVVLPNEDPWAKAYALQLKLKTIQQDALKNQFKRNKNKDYFENLNRNNILHLSNYIVEEEQQQGKCVVRSTSLFSDSPTGDSTERDM